MEENNEIDDATFDRIKEYCESGQHYFNKGNLNKSIIEYNNAWKLIPNPKNKWNASTWILAAIADAFFLSGRHISARKALEYAMTCPNAIGNPFLHLRYGQVLLDAGEKDAAANELIRAYMGDGYDIFESENPKYLAFLKSVTNI